MKNLPLKVHDIRGNHQVAVDRTKDITKYVDKAVDCLQKALGKDCEPILRAALIRQGDEYLDAIVRFAKCAKEELRVAYAPEEVE